MANFDDDRNYNNSDRYSGGGGGGYGSSNRYNDDRGGYALFFHSELISVLRTSRNMVFSRQMLDSPECPSGGFVLAHLFFAQREFLAGFRNS